MSTEDRLLQMENCFERLEKKQDQLWESYKRLLNGFLKALDGDTEERS